MDSSCEGVLNVRTEPKFSLQKRDFQSEREERDTPRLYFRHVYDDQGSQVSRIGRETHSFRPVHTLTRHTVYFSR